MANNSLHLTRDTDAPLARELSRWKAYALLMLLFLLSNCDAFAVEGAIDMKLGCKSNPQITGACFSVHGRLSTYNGTPSLRIWPIGTHRLLGVVKDEAPLSVPENIRNLVGLDKDIYGDFLVCPFSKTKPDHMQFVCVETASNIHVQMSSRRDRQ